MDILIIGAIVLIGYALAQQTGVLSSITTSPQQRQAQQYADQQITAGGSAIQMGAAQGAQATNAGIAAQQSIHTSTVNTGINIASKAGLGTAGALATGASLTMVGITAGVGAAVGIAVIEWQKHEARIAGAKREDAAWNDIFPGWQAMMEGIFGAYNSGQINKAQAAGEVLQARTLAYNAAQRFVGTPGTNWTAGQLNGAPAGLTVRKYWGYPCNKHCTVGCCLFNNVVGPASNQALDLFTSANPKGQSVQVPQTYKSGYGYTGSSAFTLTAQR